MTSTATCPAACHLVQSLGQVACSLQFAHPCPIRRVTVRAVCRKGSLFIFYAAEIRHIRTYSGEGAWRGVHRKTAVVRAASLRVHEEASLVDATGSSNGKSHNFQPSILPSGSIPAIDGPVKQCKECQHFKRVSDFEATMSTADGLHDWCRACLAAFRARQANKELYHLALSVEEAWEQGKTCLKCGMTKELRDFQRCLTRRDGLQVYCRGCLSTFSRTKPIQPPVDTPKQCVRCQEVKAASAFYPNSKASGGLNSYCKACHKAITKEGIQRRRGGVKLPRAEKRCGNCGMVKQVSEFDKKDSLVDGLATICKKCRAAGSLKGRRQKPGSEIQGTQPDS